MVFTSPASTTSCCSPIAGVPPSAPGLPGPSGPPGPPPPPGGPVLCSAAFNLIWRDANVVVAGGVPGLDGRALPPPAYTVIAGCVLVADIIGAAACMGLRFIGLLLIMLSIRSACCLLSLSGSL
jgi:hypothetical protein